MTARIVAEFTRFEATRAQLSVDFAYPIESLTGHAEFIHVRVNRAEVKER